MRRARDIRVTDDFGLELADPEARVHRRRDRWIGRHRDGNRGSENSSGEMMKTTAVDRSDVSFEGYLRFGGAF